MQLFVIDRDPQEAAQSLADCHIRKQILETAQILTAYWVNSGYARLDWMPKPQNYNHPVVKAVNRENAYWVIAHFYGLLANFNYRFNKRHAYNKLTEKYVGSFIKENLFIIHNDYSKIIETFHHMFSGFTPESGDIVSEYRQYYCWKLKQIKNFKYTHVKLPEWLEVAK